MRTPFQFSRKVEDIADDMSIPAPGGLLLRFDPTAFGGGQPSHALKAQFSQLRFGALGGPWTSGSMEEADVLIVAIDGSSAHEVDRFCRSLRESGRADRVIIYLINAELSTTRRLIREGAADVLPAPVSEPALAASLERVLGRLEIAAHPPASCEVITFLKAGGGVGSTALAVQLAAILAHGARGARVCVVDLDVQFGSAAMYLDVQDSITVSQVLSARGNLKEIGFASTLTRHSSGARVLAAPPEFMALDAVTPEVIDSLIGALRRDFDVVILDLPSAWTAWTYRALRQSNRIVLVSHLTVPHIHLIQRQIQLLETQRLSDIPLTLVCNRCGGDNPPGVSMRSVETAMGRPFDVIVPEERKLMTEAINQGVALREVRRGSKLEKALLRLGELVMAAGDAARRHRGS